jgi:hypothetical protein
MEAAVPAEIGRLWWGFGRGRSGEGRGAHHGSVCGRRRGGKAPDGGSWWWPAVPAAGAPAPVEGTRRRWRPQHGEVVWGRVEMLGRLAGGGRVELSKLAVGHRERTAASACAWAAGCTGLNSRPAPCRHDEGNTPALTPQYGAGLGRRAQQGVGDGPLGSTRRPYGATRAPRRRLAF